MAMRFKNHDSNTRMWLTLHREDGRTLELEPGETVDLDLPKDFSDPHLRPVVVKKGAAKSEKPVDPAPIDHEEKPS
jgi:hypothetical protein